MLFFKSKQKKSKNIEDGWSDTRLNDKKLNRNEPMVLSVLKNKHKWVVVSNDRENDRPLSLSSNKNKAIEDAKHICRNSDCIINIYDVENKLIKTIEIIKGKVSNN